MRKNEKTSNNTNTLKNKKIEQKTNTRKSVSSQEDEIEKNIVIRRFVRFEKGEGIEKREDNFADEVLKMVQ